VIHVIDSRICVTVTDAQIIDAKAAVKKSDYPPEFVAVALGSDVCCNPLQYPELSPLTVAPATGETI
jgi:hypothetical protein